MKEENKVEIIFQPDELNMINVKSWWEPEELLTKKGLFYLKDVTKVLPTDAIKVKKAAEEIQDQGQSPWRVMGVRKIWNHWILNMTVFSPYYRTHLEPKLTRVSTDWDGNTLLRQTGCFALSDVCRLIPFSTHQIRYQAKRRPNAREEIGVWKDEELHIFVVEMSRFAPWILRLWKMNFN